MCVPLHVCACVCVPEFVGFAFHLLILACISFLYAKCAKCHKFYGQRACKTQKRKATTTVSARRLVRVCVCGEGGEAKLPQFFLEEEEEEKSNEIRIRFIFIFMRVFIATTPTPKSEGDRAGERERDTAGGRQKNMQMVSKLRCVRYLFMKSKGKWGREGRGTSNMTIESRRKHKERMSKYALFELAILCNSCRSELSQVYPVMID